MKRTQIYIDDDILKYLKNESKIEHKTISELIRESINDKIEHNKTKIMNKLESVFGIWENKDINVNDYIRDIRKDREL